MEPVIFEKKGNLGWLILNRPETRNALSMEVMQDMQVKLNRIAGDTDVRVLIIKGRGPVFCAGHHLNEVVGAGSDIHRLREIFGVCTEMMQTLQRLPQPVIAQVHGVATAGGCQLVAACDLAIAENGARFAVPGVKIGLFCSTPMVPLVRVVGRRRALDMLLSGRFISAQEALDFGLVNRVASAETLDAETEKWAQEMAAFSLFTLGFGKRAFYRQVDMDEDSAYGYAKEAIALNCLAEDAREGMGAFLEKRTPRWKDR
jgi:enoyl-CoA hydratase/carnithine racemase